METLSNIDTDLFLFLNGLHTSWLDKVMIAVKFDSLKINSDNIVYGGRAVTYQSEAEKQESNSEVVDKLFSDWGIDNLIGDINIPYSAEIQEKENLIK